MKTHWGIGEFAWITERGGQGAVFTGRRYVEFSNGFTRDMEQYIDAMTELNLTKDEWKNRAEPASASQLREFRGG